MISDVCLTVYEFLTRVNSSRTRCYLLNCKWLQVWPVTTTCRYLFEPNSSSRLLPFLFPAAAGIKKKTACGQSCFYGLRDCEDCPPLVDAILFHRSNLKTSDHFWLITWTCAVCNTAHLRGVPLYIPIVSLHSPN